MVMLYHMVMPGKAPRSLSYGNVAKNSITCFASQMKVYFGCGCLLLKIPDKNTDIIEFEPTGMPPMVYDEQKLQTLILQFYLTENLHGSTPLKRLRYKSKDI